MRIILFLVIYSIAAHANPEASEEKPSDSSSDVVNFLDSSELEARLINFFVFGFVLMRDVRFDPYRNPIRVLMGALTAGMLYSAYHGKAHYFMVCLAHEYRHAYSLFTDGKTFLPRLRDITVRRAEDFLSAL